MFLEASCPVCDSDLVYSVDIYDMEGDGVHAYIEVVGSWELREFVSMKVVEIFSMLPLPIWKIKKMLTEQGLGNLAEKIIEEIKLQGAYESKGMLLST
jgi:hypothetical protein